MKFKLIFIIFIIWLSSLFIIYSEGKKQVQRNLDESISSIEKSLNRVLDLAFAYTITHKNQLEINLSQQTNSQLPTSLQNYPEFNIFGTKQDLMQKHPSKASLTGTGSLEALSKQVLMELNAVEALNLASPIEFNSDYFIWSYYTSKANFVSLYPAVPADVFHFTDKLYEKPYWLEALTEHNPDKTTIISDLYEDEGGKGRMISISTPVYDAETFKGVLSVDIGINFLIEVLSDSQIPYLANTLHLVDSVHGRIIATDMKHQTDNPSLTPSHIDDVILDKSQNHNLSYANQYYYLSSKLIKNTYLITYAIPENQFCYLALQTSLFKMFTATLLALVIWNVFLLFEKLRETKKLAQFDGLSQLYNRTTVEALSMIAFKQARERDQDFSVIMIDIDHFKMINDKYGHHVGDIAIKHISKIIRQTIRKTDVSGRYGGEEFIITLTNTNIENTKRLAEKLRKNIVASTYDAGKKLTASIGIASSGSNTESFEKLVYQADLALYQAKRNGRNQVRVYSNEMEVPPTT